MSNEFLLRFENWSLEYLAPNADRWSEVPVPFSTEAQAVEAAKCLYQTSGYKQWRVVHNSRLEMEL